MNCINLPEATAAVFASCARPGQARQSRDGPGQSWLYGFSASDCRERAQKRRKDTEQRQEGTTVVGPLALVRATASPAMGDI